MGLKFPSITRMRCCPLLFSVSVSWGVEQNIKIVSREDFVFQSVTIFHPQKVSNFLKLMVKIIEQTEDVTLVSNYQTQFKVHKIVLSPVFKKIIDSSPSQHPLIYMRGVQSYDSNPRSSELWSGVNITVHVSQISILDWAEQPTR